MVDLTPYPASPEPDGKQMDWSEPLDQKARRNLIPNFSDEELRNLLVAMLSQENYDAKVTVVAVREEMRSREMEKTKLFAEADDIKERVLAVATEITTHVQPEVVIAIPTASFIFAADLMRELPASLPFYEFGVTRSYQGASFHPYTNYEGKPPRQVRKTFEGKRVLIIDSCFDSGMTLETMTSTLKELFNAKETYGIVAVHKSQKHYDVQLECPVNNWLFKFSDTVAKGNPFLWGYGMDRKDGTGRGSPHIYLEEVSDA